MHCAAGKGGIWRLHQPAVLECRSAPCAVPFISPAFPGLHSCTFQIPFVASILLDAAAVKIQGHSCTSPFSSFSRFVQINFSLGSSPHVPAEREGLNVGAGIMQKLLHKLKAGSARLLGSVQGCQECPAASSPFSMEQNSAGDNLRRFVPLW